MSDDLKVWLRDVADGAASCADPRPALRQAAARIEALEDMLREAADDLTVYVEVEYPPEMRAKYPSVERRWKRDMDLVFRIREMLP